MRHSRRGAPGCAAITATLKYTCGRPEAADAAAAASSAPSAGRASTSSESVWVSLGVSRERARRRVPDLPLPGVPHVVRARREAHFFQQPQELLGRPVVALELRSTAGGVVRRIAGGGGGLPCAEPLEVAVEIEAAEKVQDLESGDVGAGLGCPAQPAKSNPRAVSKVRGLRHCEGGAAWRCAGRLWRLRASSRRGTSASCALAAPGCPRLATACTSSRNGRRTPPTTRSSGGTLQRRWVPERGHGMARCLQQSAGARAAAGKNRRELGELRERASQTWWRSFGTPGGPQGHPLAFTAGVAVGPLPLASGSVAFDAGADRTERLCVCITSDFARPVPCVWLTPDMMRRATHKGRRKSPTTRPDFLTRVFALCESMPRCMAPELTSH